VPPQFWINAAIRSVILVGSRRDTVAEPDELVWEGQLTIWNRRNSFARHATQIFDRAAREERLHAEFAE
jgi:hypothetical protein